MRYILRMNCSDLHSRLATRAATLTPQDAEAAVSLVLEAIARALVRGDRIEIRGFGSFELRYWPPRQGRNPKTGVPVQVPAKSLPKFKAGKALLDRVNGVAKRPAPPLAE